LIVAAQIPIIVALHTGVAVDHDRRAPAPSFINFTAIRACPDEYPLRRSEIAP